VGVAPQRPLVRTNTDVARSTRAYVASMSTPPLPRALAFSGLAAALALSVVVANPAQANSTYRTLPERTLANSSMNASDVPRWMTRGMMPVAEQTFIKGAAAQRPDLCLDSDGNGIQGKQPRQYMESKVTLRQNLDAFSFTEVNSNIYQYRTRAAAVRAWANLRAAVQRCAGKIEVDVETEDASVTATITTKVLTTQSLFGTPGIALIQDVELDVEAADLEIDISGDQYGNYRLAGAAIIRVEYAKVNGPMTGFIGRVNRKFVDTMATVVAQRIERRSTRS
jgi:hypothetical protein